MMPTVRLHTLAALLASLLAAAWPAAALAQTYVSIPVGSTYGEACTGSSSGNGVQRPGRFDIADGYYAGRFVCDGGVSTSPASGASSFAAGAQSLRASAAADFGTARVYAEQHVRNWQVENLFFPTARGYAGWVDELLFTSPGLIGQAGTFTATMRVTGTLSALGYQGIASFRINQLQGPGFGGERMLFDATRRDDDVALRTFDQEVTTTVSFVFGTPLRYGLFAAAQTLVGSEGGLNHLPGDALSDFDNTVRWLGITSVTAGGVPVAGYAVTTASGNAWIAGSSVVTPEPGTWALLGTGLLALGAVARRRRRA